MIGGYAQFISLHRTDGLTIQVNHWLAVLCFKNWKSLIGRSVEGLTVEAIELPGKRQTLSPVVRVLTETRKRPCIRGFPGMMQTEAMIVHFVRQKVA
jgi:hypothetical protein